uniref:PROP1-like PPR domain-containing protein n=1 Tax=Aegilops tauschii subsp. strangulata TaxID=200361 RepID=A0A453NKF0_AEGTS
MNFRLRIQAPLHYHPMTAGPRWRICACGNIQQGTSSLHDAEANSSRYGERKNRKHPGAYIDKDGEARTFDRKKISRKRGGAMRGRGWKYGSGFVDGVFPVLSPMAQDILELVQKGTDTAKVWQALDNVPPTHALWDDVLNVAVQLRLSRQWDPIISVCEWIVHRSSFRPDVVCYNLLIDAYGRTRRLGKAEAMYAALLEARCVPTEDTYALLLRAYCAAGSLHRAEGVISEMREHGIPPSATVYNAYLDGLLKARCAEKAVEVYQRMKRERCRTNTETYTLMINVYGKSKQPMSAMKVFKEMQSLGCKANICTYTALVNAFAREGLCEKAEEVFEEMQQAGHEPDVYAYNALMEAYSRAGFPQAAAEIFSLMQHMGCEPDRASYNILVDAYGRSGLHRGTYANHGLLERRLLRRGAEPDSHGVSDGRRGGGRVRVAEAAGDGADDEVAHAAAGGARQVRQRGAVRGGDGAAAQVRPRPGHLRAQRHAQRLRPRRPPRRHGAAPRRHGAPGDARRGHVQRGRQRLRPRRVPGEDGGGVRVAGGEGPRRRRGHVDVPHGRLLQEEGVPEVPGDLRGDGGRRVLPGRRDRQGARRRLLRRAAGGAGHGHRQVHAQGGQNLVHHMTKMKTNLVLIS